MSHARALAICAIGVVCSTYAFGGQVLSRYRNFEFDSNVTSISALAGLAPSEAKVIHQQPAVFQNLEWRPSHWIAESTAESTDPVETVLFSFYDDQLFRVVVDYRRKRTEGMTGADMIEGISADYGTPLPRTSRAAARAASRLEAESGSSVARWGDSEHAVVLYQSSSYDAAFLCS